ncbi:Ubiquilin-1 [Phytophthora citrophthora]|uniref:Ubiquilin-1 n=1 Tax=Phytophthora citrophthora TaxID=4793 RepID=A0AAD9GCC6_9STRA|nr:Ubiquilin-1 [Phytophthora citrophthora]
MDELTVKVVSGTSENLLVRVDLASSSVLGLKQVIEQQDARRFPVSAQRLIFQGQILQDDKLLKDYNVAAGCALHLTLTPSAVAAANAAATQVTGPAPPTQLRAFLQQMRDQEPHEQYATAVRTLQKICSNIVGHPNEEKYRKLRVDNAALKAKLFDRIRGQDSVKVVGFQDGVMAGHLVLVPTPEKWENLVACKAVMDSVATSLGAAAPAPTTPFGAPSMGGFGGMGGDFASQAQALLQNPAMLQSMASNPMVQQMAQQNPMLAQALQNPALLAQSMQALQQNPAMMQQMNQMMSDPNAMARMQQMMAGGGMGGLGGFGGSPFGAAAPSPAAANPFAASSSASNPFAPPPPPAAPAPAPTSAPVPTPPASTPDPTGASTASAATATSSSTENDETYEEDEIAKAIARSLQDQ